MSVVNRIFSRRIQDIFRFRARMSLVTITDANLRISTLQPKPFADKRDSEFRASAFCRNFSKLISDGGRRRNEALIRTSRKLIWKTVDGRLSN